MGDLIFFTRPMNAVMAIRACRRELAEFLPPDSGISRSLCVSLINRLLTLTVIQPGPREADEIIERARDILRNGMMSPEQKLDQLFLVFESPEAERFAAPDLPKLIYSD